MQVSLFMPTMNRLEFTRLALEELFKWTPSGLIHELLVVDGRSEDGTAEFLRETLKNAPFRSHMETIDERHVVNAMLVARDHLKTDLIAKLDSDTMVCAGWLEKSLEVINQDPNLWALGIHGRGLLESGAVRAYEYKAAQFVGGIGVFRKKAWEGLRPNGKTYFGWTAHQHGASWGKGWLTPGLPVFLLNLLAFEPFASLSEEYVRLGWQRKGRFYSDDESDLWSWRFPDWKSKRRA